MADADPSTTLPRCMHNSPPARPDALTDSTGALLNGVVVCVHVFGLGVYLPEFDDFGHVDVPSIGSHETGPGLEGYPPIGDHVRVRVLGRPRTQLRLAVLPPAPVT